MPITEFLEYKAAECYHRVTHMDRVPISGSPGRKKDFMLHKGSEMGH